MDNEAACNITHKTARTSKRATANYAKHDFPSQSRFGNQPTCASPRQCRMPAGLEH